MRRCLAAIAAALAFVPTAALAHSGLGHVHGFVQGFAHPLGGIDHVLAMVTVGVFAWQLGGRALWLVPATFVLMMAAGGAIGIAGVELPSVEFGIAASVVVLGAIVALKRKAPLAVAIGVVGAFAVFHGHAHGTEMPPDALGAAYAAGFLLATRCCMPAASRSASASAGSEKLWRLQLPARWRTGGAGRCCASRLGGVIAGR